MILGPSTKHKKLSQKIQILSGHPSRIIHLGFTLLGGRFIMDKITYKDLFMSDPELVCYSAHF